MSQEDIKKRLSDLLSKDVLIVGIGNTLRSDDGFGPLLVSALKGKVKADCLDAGLSPENYIGKIVKLKPKTILFIDVISSDEPVATIKLIKEDEIPLYGFSTHNMSPKLMIEHIKAQIKTDIYLLGIQPKNLEFGEGMSNELKESLDFLYNIFVDILGNKK
jgi:hydrogenase 3 maturation protease